MPTDTANLPPETLEILRQVEELTKKPVKVVPDSSLRVLAKIQAARGSASEHVLTYKPNRPETAYHVAYECGFVLRQFANPPDARFDFTDTPSGRSAVSRMIQGPGGTLAKSGMPPVALMQLSAQIFDGLMTQLRSIPVGMRIDSWIWNTHPGLREAQKASIASQQRDNVQVLNPQLRKMVPPTVFNSSVTINAAYALFCDRLLDGKLYSVAYRATGFVDRAIQLLSLFDSIADDPSTDRQLIDAWADELGLSDWYEWKPLG